MLCPRAIVSDREELFKEPERGEHVLRLVVAALGDELEHLLVGALVELCQQHHDTHPAAVITLA